MPNPLTGTKKNFYYITITPDKNYHNPLFGASPTGTCLCCTQTSTYYLLVPQKKNNFILEKHGRYFN